MLAFLFGVVVTGLLTESLQHYARIVHNANLDGHGYAFPYDDVTPDGGVPQEGAVFSYSPALLIVTAGWQACPCWVE